MYCIEKLSKIPPKVQCCCPLQGKLYKIFIVRELSDRGTVGCFTFRVREKLNVRTHSPGMAGSPGGSPGLAGSPGGSPGLAGSPGGSPGLAGSPGGSPGLAGSPGGLPWNGRISGGAPLEWPELREALLELGI
uniref:Uncharacterized protein n=1 Tax=Esox lucius TaxID=8010 RepID=A0AAY5KTN7_ESOLU